MTYTVVVTMEGPQGSEQEWRGEFTGEGIDHLWSYFSGGCEVGTLEVWEDGEREEDY